jgi:protocatechuate 3,4-dioxygenase beta subunit
MVRAPVLRDPFMASGGALTLLDMETRVQRDISRRRALTGLMIGTTGMGLVAEPVQAETTPAEQPKGICTLFPQAVEGPYYFDPKLVRSDITDGRPGQPMKLVLKVIESGRCLPIAGTRVDIWHADAGGIYSGYDRQGDQRDVSTKGETYLRGTQITDAKGTATFHTIYPGWYPGRTPHIHVKAFLDTLMLVTGQIYFEDELSTRIYRERQPYAARPTRDTDNEADFIFKSGEREGGGIVFAVKEEPDLLIASLIIAVDRSGPAAKRASGWGSYLRQMIGL